MEVSHLRTDLEKDVTTESEGDIDKIFIEHLLQHSLARRI